MSPDYCPLCGTSVALLRRPDPRSDRERLHARIASLRDRAERLERGELTPGGLKEQTLWMCAACQPLLAGRSRIDESEAQRRIHEEVRRLERGARARQTRAS